MLPIIDLDVFRRDPGSPEAIAEARKTADALIQYGALVCYDSTVTESANETFLDLMEDYFAQSREELEQDLRPEFGYQVGATLENTEKPRCGTDEGCQALIETLEPSERPLSMKNADPKCRFFYKMATPSPEKTDYPTLSMPNVIPERFKEHWDRDMSAWGSQLKGAVETVTRLLGVGLGVGEDYFTKAAEFGNHLLAPTASDLVKYGKLNSVLAGFHNDLNFLTIHGRSRYPGLHIWARSKGKRIEVGTPPGHLLVQAGKQLEHITGGLILAGMHEVVVTERTVATLAKRSADPATADRPKIRISSTFFHHLSSDFNLEPDTFKALMEKGSAAPYLKDDELSCQRAAYGHKKVGSLVQDELRHIALLA